MRELMREGYFQRGVLPGIYGEGADNLGNLQGEAYLREMRPVYAGCYQVLRPGGLLAVVIQPERKDERLIPLHHETVRLCTDLGFHFLDEITAILGRVAVEPEGATRIIPHASFWRRLNVAHLRAGGSPVTLGQVEYVLLFRKPAAPPVAPVRRRAPTHKGGLSTALAGP